MQELLEFTEHRSWPLPSGPWIMKQTWNDLLFAHWPVALEAIRPLVPKQLPLDVHGGKCWVGVIPFWMSGIRGRGLPPIPGMSRFPELNVRTYVTYGGKPGVYFFSLDAASLPAVWAARRFYRLPYFHATMNSREEGGSIRYSSQRRNHPAEFRANYKPIGSVRLSNKESLERFVTERYCLYTVRREHVHRCEIHHLPWPLQDAQAEFERNTMAAAAGIALPETRPLLHFAKRLDVLIWPLRRAD